MTVYPLAKDTSSGFLVINGVTPIDSTLFAKFSSAILAIESELGINPSGVFSDIRQRLDMIDGYTSSGGFLPTATLKQHLEYDGTSWVAVDDFTFSENPGDTRIITITDPTTTPTNITIKTPNNLGTNNSGIININTGDGGNTSGISGGIYLISGSSYGNSNILTDGVINLTAGTQLNDGYAGNINITAGTGENLSSYGGNINIIPGSANLQNNLGKIFINAASLYGQPEFTNQYYPVYIKTNNINGNYPGIRYNNSLSKWEYKIDGENELSWHDLISSSSTSAVSSVIDILWDISVIDGYLVYTDSYSSSPELKISKLAIANNYLYSNVIGAAYSETNKVITNGVHSVYCETSASPGDILYLSTINYGMVTTTIPTSSNECIVIVGKCFTEKSSGIGTCNVLLNIREPILLE